MTTDGWDSSRQAALVLLGLALAAIAATAEVGPQGVGGAPAELLLLIAVGLVAAFHRPFGQRGAAAAVAAWPLVALGWGAATAATIAAVTVLAADALRALVASRRPLAPPARWRPWATGAAAARTALAVVAAALAAAGAGDLAGRNGWASLAAGTATYLAIALLASVGERAWRPGRRRVGRILPPPRSFLARAVEAAAWAVGASLLAAPRSTALVVLVAGALLLAEAARQSAAAARLDERLGELGRVQGAGERMVGGPTEIGSVVERIRAECANLLTFRWFQLELSPGDGEPGRSWWAGPDGVLADGAPEPDPYPPMIPGIHRRSEWRRLERQLSGAEGPVARLTLWCDPRQLDPQDLTLFEALLPQMATSIRQALLDREARHDQLTGAVVRRVLEKRLFDAFRRAVDEGRALAVVMVDVDRFKPINDRYGHAAGDRALAAVGAALEEHKRNQDLLARYGGEEFTLLLEDADGATALAVAERLRRAIEEIDLEVDGLPLALTVSAGVAAFPEVHVKTPSELLLLADGALYEAKNRGRNRCLLDLGRARYRTAAGEVLASDGAVPEPPPPRIFA